ncbi:putative UDP-glucosyltransferase [Tripterygium wilfordii]|uniref:Glycosyltransferase n=1 Tax=Tripterygium wilfordii TaxID=458696 RepID=A0A7J7CQ58_TRIWF|nr:UDP-glycosyltransferase 84B2-like [Tripterygium wilfordii]KAF5736191.1 putative UDP-glucosyltransferase [Tripterygium wilfordii]
MGFGEQVNVLVVTLALQGHMNPMLKLSKLLVSKGLHVTLVTTELARHLMLKSNINGAFNNTQQTTNTNSPAINLEFFSDGLSEDFNRDNNHDIFMEFLRTKGSENLSNLITNLTTNGGKKFSCIICNPFIPWVAAVAAKHDIPCAMLWIQASAVFSIYYHFFKHPNLFPKSLDDPKETVELPGLPILEVQDLPSFILPSAPKSFNKMVSDIFSNVDKIKWVLGNSFNELEEDVINSLALTSSPILPIGPLVSPFLLGNEEKISGNIDMWSAEGSCIEWLDKKPTSSVIYISFGSILVLSQQQIDSIAIALRNSKKPFLWVIKPPQKNSEKKCGELPIGFLEETKGRGLVVAWSPQEKVLIHKAVACFITHCGWNSTLETASAGVPVIAYPEWTDQPTDAKLLVDVLKVGVRMRNDKDGVLSQKEVERCIMEVTDGPNAEKIRKRALELKEAAKKAVAPGGSSDKNIDQFIKEISV